MWSATPVPRAVAEAVSGEKVVPVRLATHAVFRTESGDRVVKVFTPGLRVLPMQVQVALLPRHVWLPPLDHGVHDGVSWAVFPAGEDVSTGEELVEAVHEWASVLRTLDTGPLPHQDHLGSIRTRLFSPLGQRRISAAQRSVLLHEAELLAEQLGEDDECAIHGDLSTSNCVRYGGSPVLIDFDSMTVSSPALEAASLLIMERRFGTQGLDHEGVQRTLGVDGALVESAYHLRAMRMATWALTLDEDNPAHRAEMDKRLSWLLRPLDGDNGLWKAVK